MFISDTKIRIHYALTDQMGFVYYGNYAQFYEIGRTEAIRRCNFVFYGSGWIETLYDACCIKG